jgi:alpha-methylacyl-CoA racemase
MLGPKGQPPMPPANLLGDYAGGGLVAFAGVLLALIHRGVSGEGQVVEANMVDGASYIATIPRLRQKESVWDAPRGTNLLDGGCPYYRCYECQDDGKFVSVGALEPPFFARLLKGLELNPDQVVPPGMRREDKRAWPSMQIVLARRFRQKPRKEWESIFDGTDACVVPVLENEELESAGHEQRPIVNLTQSASFPVDSPWKGKRLKAGDGGEKILRLWMGWERGKDFDILNGVYVTLEVTQSKL